MKHEEKAARSRSLMRGFTLVELVVTIAIVGILAAIAFPSYRTYVVRANRADAQQALLQAGQDAERYFAANNKYTGYTVPSSLRRTPESGTKVYDIAIQGTPNATTFTLRATPTAAASNSTDGYMEITSTGVKRWDRNNDNAIAANSNETNWSR